MISSHELLLIVRAQNQASALMSRVSRDIRRMQQQRDMELRRSAMLNRLQRNSIQQMREAQRINSVMTDQGAQRLAHEQSLARNALQQNNIKDRIANLDVRRTGIQRALANLDTQQLRMDQQRLRIEQSIEKLETRRMGMQGQIGRMNTQLMRNQNQMADLNRREFGLETQRMERQLKYQQSIRRLAAAQKGGAGAKNLADLTTQTEIARRRRDETVMAQGGVAGQRNVLGAQAGNIRSSIATAQQAIKGLAGEEASLAKSSEILTSRQKALAYQLDNVTARGHAVTAAERQLRDELTVVENELGRVNARWEQHRATTRQSIQNLRILRNEESALNAQLAEQNALIARQNSERIANIGRTVSHTGRIIQIAGGIGAAGLTAMAIAAAHLNQEVMATSTQTGPINANAQLIVSNSEKIQKAIVETMRVIPANQNELNDALYNIYSSMDTTFTGGIKLLKLFGQVWVAGGMHAFAGDVNDVGDALITLGNNWNISGNDMAAWRKLANSTLATVRYGRLTVEQYTQTMNQLAPAFRGSNQSIEQMNGALAFLTRLLPSSRVTAAGIARMMEVIQRFAAHPVAGFEDLAKSIVDAEGNLKPLNQVIELMISHNPELQKSGVYLNNYFKTISNQQGTVQARRAFQAFIKQQDLYESILKRTTTNQTQFNKSLKAMEQSTGVRWEQFLNDMKAIALELGTAATPALLEFGSYIQRATDYFAGLDDSTKKTIATIAVFVTIGALIVGTLAAVLGTFAVMIVSLRVLGGTRGFGGLSRLMGSGGAAGAAKALSSEAGFVNLRFLGIAGTIAAVVAILIPFHNQVMAATDVIGGLGTVFKILVNVLTIFTLSRVIGGLMATRVAAGLATTQVLALRTALLGIGLLGAITVPIVLSLSKQFDKDPRSKSNNAVERAVLAGARATPIVGGVLESTIKAGGQAGRNFMDAMGWSDMARQLKARQNMSKKGFERINLSELMRINEQIRNSPVVPDLIKSMAQTAFINGDLESLNMIDKMRARMSQTGTSGAGTAGNKATASVFQGISDSKIASSVRQVSALQKAFEDAPSPAKWRAFHTAMDKATKGLTKDQKAMFDDLLSQYGQAEEAVKHIADSTVLSMQRNIKHLEMVAKKTGAMKDFVALQKAQTELGKVATSEQISAAQQVLEAEDAISQKRTENAKKALALHKQNMEKARDLIQQTTDSITQMYQSSLEKNQQAFGELFSGRFITTSATVLNRAQFGKGLRPSDLMKDLNMQVSDFSKFSTTLDKLRTRGAPQEMISQISQMGPEAQKQITALLNFTPQQFQRYVRSFNKGQALIQKQTESDVKAQLQKWERFGKKVQLAIINGMQSENKGLENAILATVKKMFPGLTKQAGSAAPKSTGDTHNHYYHLDPSATPAGTKTAIKEAQFKFKNRKPPLL